MDEVKPVKLPLPADVSRCLGHNGRFKDHCVRRDDCARHVTISVQNEPWEETKPPYYQMCSNESFACFMEIANG